MNQVPNDDPRKAVENTADQAHEIRVHVITAYMEIQKLMMKHLEELKAKSLVDDETAWTFYSRVLNMQIAQVYGPLMKPVKP